MADVKNDIEKYLRGELTPAEMHALERRALSDPFLAEALEGAEAAGPENFSVDIESLQASIEERVSQASGKVMSIWFWPTRIAAGLALVAISAFIILSLVQRDETLHEIAQVKETVPVPSPEKSSAAPDTVMERDEVISSSNKKELLSMAKPEEPKSVEKPLATSPVVEQRREVLADKNASGIQLQDADGIVKLEPQEQPSSAGYHYTVTEKSEKQSEAEAIARDVFSDDDAKKDKAAPVADELAKRKMTGAPVASRAASEESKPAQKFIRGKVTSTDGTELIGVNVIIKGTNIGTVTDAGGNYQLAVKDENPDLLFSFIGLETKEVEAGNRQEVNVEMNDDISQLSEVVVVGYGAENKDEEEEIPTVEFASPAGGRSEFKRYLEKNLVYPEKALESKIEGRVTIQFTVEKSGELTNFKVIKGIGYGCDEEVIRLIKEGPKWAATKRNEEPVKDKVKVRMRFRLNKK